MSSLRFLRGLVLAVAGSALAVFSWALPVRADALLPQAPGPQPTLTVAAQVQGGNVTISGSLSFAGQPIDKASIQISLDGKNLGKTNTGPDGSYSTSTNVPAPGNHVVTASFSGDKLYSGVDATTQFTVAAPAPTTKAPPPPTTAAPPTTVISATLSPNPVPVGSVLGVTGTVTSGGTPVDLSSLTISCDFGGVSTLGVTDSAGNFSVNLTLPTTGQPPSLTVTVSFAGDARFPAAKASFQSAVSPASPSSVATPSISASASVPATASASTRPSVPANTTSAAPRGGSTPAATFGVVFGIVGATSVAALGVLWVLARRRHDLLPGERRGFGSDFGHTGGSA